MSLAGRPRTIAKKAARAAHSTAVAKARANFEAEVAPARIAYDELILPARERLQKAVEDADMAYFDAVPPR